MRLFTTLNGPERTAEIRQLEARSTPPRFTAYASSTRDERMDSRRRLMQEYPAGHEDHAVGAPEGTIPGIDKVSEDRRGGR
jgi:hypothetical protein